MQPVPVEHEQPIPVEYAQPIPVERVQQPIPIERELPRPIEREQPIPVERVQQPIPVERELPRPVERELPRPVEVPVPLFVGVDPFKAEPVVLKALDDEPAELAAIEEPPQPQPENYTEKYLDIDELYEALALRTKRTDTIYLIEEYLKTLPDSLPEESRREIVSKIVAASGFDYDLLMGDGVLRVKMLKEYAERFARHTDDYVSARQAELDELDQKILRIRRLIENRRELHKKQFFAIEAEAQRLKEILTFISG